MKLVYFRKDEPPKNALFYPEKTKDNVLPNVCDEHNYMAALRRGENAEYNAALETLEKKYLSIL